MGEQLFDAAEADDDVRGLHDQLKAPGAGQDIADALTGQQLDVLQQCVAIEVTGGGAELASVVDARSLAAWLRTLHEERLAGGEASACFAAALLTPLLLGSAVTALDMCHNHIAACGGHIDQLREALEVNMHLRTLSLRRCCIGGWRRARAS